MVYAVTPRLPPPVGPLRWDAQAAALRRPAPTTVPSSSDSKDYLATRNATAQRLHAAAFDRILARQRAHAAQQRARRESRRKGGKGKPLVVGDLAYLLTRAGGFKPLVQGPFVVTKISDHTIELRTTNLVEGQPSKAFSVHAERVARCTTVTDVLEDLLKHAQVVQELPKDSPDTLAAKHVESSNP
jgi:hypothetical protein